MAGRNGIAVVAKLQELVATMERDIGLSKYSVEERRVMYALKALSATTDADVKGTALREHVLCSEMSRPTFYRSIQSLIKQGVIVRSKGTRSGSYRLCP